MLGKGAIDINLSAWVDIVQIFCQFMHLPARTNDDSNKWRVKVSFAVSVNLVKGVIADLILEVWGRATMDPFY